MRYPKIRYEEGKLVVNEPLGTCCLVHYNRQNAISEIFISEVNCSLFSVKLIDLADLYF